jgi:acetyl esterase/lipase
MIQNLIRLFNLIATLPALLIPLRAPTYRLWMLRVGVTEWGHYSIALAVLALLRPVRRYVGPVNTALSILAAGLFTIPILRAIPIARRLPNELHHAFGASAAYRASAQSRQQPLVWRDLVLGIRLQRTAPQRRHYVTHLGSNLLLDFFAAKSILPAPLIVVIHGGGWRGGDPTQLPDLNYYLSEQGYAVASISYRLAPEHQFPAAYEDVCAAIEFLKQHAGEYNINANRIVLLGRSAGGHLALLAAYRNNDPSIRGVVAFYPPTDMHFGFANPGNPRVLDSDCILRSFLGGSPTDVSDQYDAASPITFVGPDTPPTLLIHGTTDELVWCVNSQRLARQLAQQQRPHYLLELPWATHGCDANLSGPSGQMSTYAIERFLAATLATEA